MGKPLKALTNHAGWIKKHTCWKKSSPSWQSKVLGGRNCEKSIVLNLSRIKKTKTKQWNKNVLLALNVKLSPYFSLTYFSDEQDFKKKISNA